jgi:hypothetical protein
MTFWEKTIVEKGRSRLKPKVLLSARLIHVDHREIILAASKYGVMVLKVPLRYRVEDIIHFFRNGFFFSFTHSNR